MLLIFPKDKFFAEILVFSNIFGFPTSAYLLFQNTYDQSFSKIKQYLGN